MFGQAGFDRGAIRIHHDLGDLRDGLKRAYYVME
jgi:hypothetical protein